jgi:putative transposase
MIYHVCNKSIAGFNIFKTNEEFLRIIIGICYYRTTNRKLRLADFLRSRKRKNNRDLFCEIVSLSEKEKGVEIIAYCPMPTHLHMLLNGSSNSAVSTFINNVLNSYTRYFNRRHKRKGPLWEGPSKKVLIKTDEQLLHVTRYIHLNPVSANLVKSPEKWPYSSYKEYITKVPCEERICEFADILDIQAKEYKKFVRDGIDYQRQIAQIKKLILE